LKQAEKCVRLCSYFLFFFRPKTFPATTYSGNSRQRLQEIREGLKQPSKSSDAARQQQMRPTAKFGPYQKALREIRYSLLPFANESGTSASTEVNRQMLQELVNVGCDQVFGSIFPFVCGTNLRCWF
uniref:Uncharacterized protein n=1 Tax=Chelydra serpentina TaxID=8475 RepID=A0A8C3RUQ2_CHESE